MEISLNEYQILGPGDRIEAGDVHTAALNEYARGYVDTLSSAPHWIGAKTSEYPGFRFARKKTEETNMSKFKVGDRVRVVSDYWNGAGEPRKGTEGVVAIEPAYLGCSVVWVDFPGLPQWSIYTDKLELIDTWRKLAPAEDAEEGDEARGNGKVFVFDYSLCIKTGTCLWYDFEVRELGFEIYRKVKPIDPSNTPPDEQLWGAVWLEGCPLVQNSRVSTIQNSDVELTGDVLEAEAMDRGYGGAWW